MSDLVPPFFWIEGHDVEAFDSLEGLARSVEAYDVNDLLFVDAHGTRLTATTQKHTVTGFVVAPGAPNESAKLESTLRSYLEDFETAPVGASTALPELVERFIAFRDRPGSRGWRRLLRPRG